jgi:hypothetical protein
MSWHRGAYLCFSNARDSRRSETIIVGPAAKVQVRTRRELCRSLSSTYYRNGSLPPKVALVLQCESQGLQNPYSSVRSRPAPPTFQPVNPTQIKGLSRLPHASCGRVFLACNMPDFAPKWQMMLVPEATYPASTDWSRVGLTPGQIRVRFHLESRDNNTTRHPLPTSITT